MFVEIGSTGFTRIVADTERNAEVKRIGGPPRGDVDMTLDDMLLTWEHRQITFRALRTKIVDYTLDDTGDLIETTRPMLVDIQDLGGGGKHVVDQTEYPSYSFSSSSEHAVATELAVDGFLAWYLCRRYDKPLTMDFLLHDPLPVQDPLLGTLHNARIETVAVSPTAG